MLSNLDPKGEIWQLCQQSKVGKLLPNALYVHTSALNSLTPQLQNYESRVRQTNKRLAEATLIKFNFNKPKISYLFYPDFDEDPHPSLQSSIQVDVLSLETSYRDYSSSENPPILHRKEAFVTADYPLYQKFAQLTLTEEALGLLDKSRFIGTQKEWQQRLANYGVELQGHYLACPLHKAQKTRTIRIERHKAAMVRKSLSRPVRLALEADLFPPGTTFFDYGCGWGGDIERMAKKGYHSSGWDPYYCPETALTAADVVNLGYIINVIEDLAERREALVEAWNLTQQVLIVAAQVLISSSSRGQIAYGDGVITNRNTFQKYYEQEELKSYIDQVLDVDAIPVGLGIYFVFRDGTQAQTFRASRFRSRATTPRVCKPVRRFEDYQELLAPLMIFITERGRLPAKGELAEEVALKEEFGTLHRAFKLILQATDPQEWEAIAEKRRQDLRLYLALAKLNQTPKLREFAPRVKEDFKSLFGSYRQATFEAEDMLFSLGDPEVIAECCLHSKIGQKGRNSLIVHISALENLDPLLRLYEGCASRTIGRMEEVTLIKFHIRKPKISYLFYPDFDTEPHPLLHTSMQIDLQDLHVSYWEHDPENPPVLHRKETLVTTDYPFYEKFARLSRQEQDWGLLDEPNNIRYLQGWLKYLENHCATFKGHFLVWRKDADPYKVKLLKAAVQARRRGR